MTLLISAVVSAALRDDLAALVMVVFVLTVACVRRNQPTSSVIVVEA